jgi:hypothetical protein
MPNSQVLFPGLSPYGNYESNRVPPKGVSRIPLDGSIRIVKSLGIPYVDIVSVECAYGSTYLPRRVGYAIPSQDKRKLTAALKRSESNRISRKPQPHPDLLLCIREASRAAHRWRDASREYYSTGRHDLAVKARKCKDKWYGLKDRGIVAAHKQSLVRYIGASPQCMAVYEYGDGGMSCYHSTLHPAGAERTPVEGHPESLFVPAKDKAKGISIARVEATLSALPPDTTGYERSSAPHVVRVERLPQCWTCGEFGHTARECDDSDWSDELQILSSALTADAPESESHGTGI